MPPIHVAGEMAVWNEEKWAAFETELQRQMQAERRRLYGAHTARRGKRDWLMETAAWGFFAASVVLLLVF